MKKFLPILTISLAVALFSGCSDDDEPENVDNKKAKITLSVSGSFDKAEGDHFSLGVGGATAAGSYVDWQVDGEVEKGILISLGSDDVDGGNSGITIESVQGFFSGQLSIGGFNIGGEPYTVTYRIEVDGKVVDEQIIESEPGDDPFAKAYQL